MISCPASYDAFMNTIFDIPSRNYIENAIGNICLRNYDKVHQFNIIYGPPKSGKTVLLNMLRRIFGDDNIIYCIEVAKYLPGPHILLIQDGDADKIINKCIGDDDLNDTTFFIATNRYPEIRNSHVNILKTTGEIIDEKTFNDFIYPSMIYGVKNYRDYCNDKLCWNLKFWKEKGGSNV